MDTELQRFKTDISLSEYAASRGYRLDRRESSRNSIVMRHDASNDKVIMTRQHDGHWTYFSVRDRSDHGSIVDFIQRRTGMNIGEVRCELRPWLDGGRSIDRPLPEHYRQDVEPVVRDRQAVVRAFSRTWPVRHSSYLDSRCITADLLRSDRFQGTVHRDQRGNVVFPYHDDNGLCGFEMKHHGYTGFSRHGEKGVWSSNSGLADNCLVITESPIDAMSYHLLHGDHHTRYISVGGQYRKKQRELVISAMDRMLSGSVVVMAFDNDTQGQVFAEEFTAMAPEHVRVIRALPETGKDWNDQLTARQLSLQH